MTPCWGFPILAELCPPQGKRGWFNCQTLATMHEAHQNALAAVATLEEEINRLSCIQTCSQSRVQSKSRGCQSLSREGWKKRHQHIWFEDQPTPSCSTNPETESGEQESNGGNSNLEEPLELQPTMASFLRGSPEVSEDDTKEELPVLEFQLWVPWQARKCETPEWWPSYQQCQIGMMLKNWLGRCRHLLDSHGRCRN